MHHTKDEHTKMMIINYK